MTLIGKVLPQNVNMSGQIDLPSLVSEARERLARKQG
jgi:hypothetical protein